jgi:large subunit ribosomal protein L19e
MKLNKKKELAAKTLKVGKNRIILENSAMQEISEAITKQDIRDLFNQGIIKIKEKKGKKKKVKRKTKRRAGKVKMKPKKRKQEYVKITRKLRRYVKGLKEQGKIENENYKDLRKKIRMRKFKSKSQLKEYLGENENN